ncbi:Dodecin [Methylobacterium longum]|nr:Dodecin [Methylobacterium longum]
MTSHIYLAAEVHRLSLLCMNDAIRYTTASASQTIHYLKWCEVIKSSGHSERDHSPSEFRINVKLGFR